MNPKDLKRLGEYLRQFPKELLIPRDMAAAEAKAGFPGQWTVWHLWDKYDKAMQQRRDK